MRPGSFLLSLLLSILCGSVQSFAYVMPVFASDSVQLTKAADLTEAIQFQSQAQALERRLEGLSTRPKIGLALGGGGARGAAHVGVLKVLEREGIKFDCVVGTSIGSVVGGFYCLGVKPEEMEEPVVSARVMRQFMTVPIAFQVMALPFFYISRFFGVKSYDGLYGGKAFKEHLMAGMSTRDVEIEELKIPFAAVTFNLLDGETYLIKKGHLARAMTASCAVPVLRKPIPIDDYLMSDGGLVCNLPVKQCREMGADIVIAVNIDEPFEKQDAEKFRPFGSVGRRAIAWKLASIDKPQGMMADILIHPDTSGISLISTKRADARRALLAGEKAAEEALPAIRALLKKVGGNTETSPPAN